jgi:hypothetical protein
MNIPIRIISAAVVGAAGHPGGVPAVANGVTLAVAVAVAVAAGLGLALGVAVGGIAVLTEVQAARTNPIATTTSGRIAEGAGDALPRCRWRRSACMVGPIIGA